MNIDDPHDRSPANRSRRRFIAGTIAAGVGIQGGFQIARAEDSDIYPSKMITIVVPFSAGGTTDILARLIGQKLAERWKVPVVIENKVGAGGNIGTAYVARSAANGYTLVLGTIGTHAINSSLYRNMPYDALKDFAPITRTAMVPNALVVNANAPFNTVRELIEYGKANPGKLVFGSSGHGSTLQMSGELFKMMTQVEMIHVPYKGSSPAVIDLLSNQISMIFDNMPSALPYVKTGKFKALAVTSSKRVAQLPEVPTMAEAGVPGYEVMSWFGLWAPAKTPGQIVEKLNKAVVEVLALPDVQQKIREQGAIPFPESPAEFEGFIRSESEKWSKVVKAAKLTAL
ncbi:Bug family tripartite tricarboxylate transporter substrate binding protein [Noviherbaspirillum sp. Root189]|uniref:Bug family tripartite tricarboxylate transporter substrate binding protein n=1 Tax=Noviherbaspirillum sp. Root189 TaxID=1736487 RepID=UPI000709300A|nr:tripartite tricarboxylate transporter substrate binding protein [Noviherbaspirillum sp. Root189]KRB67943.1 LacI family transcriptional regulator [Noviherbaspirillum sp. Root189]